MDRKPPCTGAMSLFRRRYPNVTLHADRILVQSGVGHSIVCAGGASSWQDLALLLIARHAGTEEAIRISKLFLYQWHRDGQLPYAAMIIEEAKRLLERGSTSIEAVAQEVGYEDMASFRRLFRRLAGMAPGDYRRKFQVPAFVSRVVPAPKRAGQAKPEAKVLAPSKPWPSRKGVRAAS